MIKKEKILTISNCPIPQANHQEASAEQQPAQIDS